MYVLIIVTFYLWSENTSARHSRASTAVIGGTISLPWILFRVHYNSCPYSCKNGNVPLHSIVSVNYNYVHEYCTYLYGTSAARCKEGGATGYPSLTRKVAGYMKIYGIELCSVRGKLVPALLLWVN